MIRMLRTSLSRLLRGWRVERNNPGMQANHPMVWDYDDVTKIRIGNDVYIGAFTEIAVISRSPFSSVPGALEIGDRTQIGSGCNIRACGGKIEIGANCIIAQHVSIIAANHEIRAGAIYRDLPWDATRQGNRIGKNVWIGAGVTILPGCSIGDNAIVAAGSVVTKSVPADEIWGNIPARRIRAIEP